MERGTGRLGIKMFLALYHKRPVEPLVTPEQYTAFLQMDPNFLSAASSSRPKPPRSVSNRPAFKIKARPRPGRAVKAPPEPQPLPPECRDFLANKGVALEGGDLKLIFVRILFPTEISCHHGRLSLPCRQAKEEFLTRGEELGLPAEDMEVTVVDPLMTERKMLLGKWNVGNGWSYVLFRDWKKIVLDNGLLAWDVIQVWSFRINGELGFLIHKIASAPAREGIDF